MVKEAGGFVISANEVEWYHHNIVWKKTGKFGKSPTIRQSFFSSIVIVIILSHVPVESEGIAS